MVAALSRLRQYGRRHWHAFLVLFLVWVVFFSPLLSGQAFYFLDDLKIIYYPLEHYYAQVQRAGQLPVWSNEFGFGHPVLAWGQLGFFTPLHLMMRAVGIPPLVLLQISVVTYFALGLLGMYAFLRRHTSSAAAVLGAIVFVFSGFNIGHLNHVNFYTTTMLLPWLLLAVDHFICRPTIRRSLAVGMMGAAMALSGQPQVILYSFTIAAVVTLALLGSRIRFLVSHGRRAAQLVAGGLVASLLAITVGSFAILPLYEFLSQTERSGGLPELELFEFSYPPYHAITLILPYFFGDHSQYWGPKGFQELAAFVGIVPLLLGSLALAYWKGERALREAATVLLLIGVGGALGRYSSVYTWLVEHKFITSLSVPGRFVFFFDVALALLSALGLDGLRQLRQLAPRWRMMLSVATFIIPGVVLAPFFIYTQSDTRVYQQFVEIMGAWQLHWVLALAGLVFFIIALLFASRLHRYRYASAAVRIGLVSVSALTLVAMAWNYNPRQVRHLAETPPPFISLLQKYAATTGLPARLYSAENILSSTPPVYGILPTDHISPTFTVHQRITIQKSGLSCLNIPIHINAAYRGLLQVHIRKNITDAPSQTFTFSPTQLSASEPLQLCSDLLASGAGQSFFLSFESTQQSPVQLLYTTYHQEEDPAYFVRVPNPTSSQLSASRKNARIVFEPTYAPNADLDVALLHRHLHVLAGTSSARWIGALSIGNYRAFIEQFFANDREPIDGDGIHALVRFRTLLNMVGVTHLIQTLPHGADDGLVAAGYELLETYDFGPKEVRLYQNPEALPKAFLVSNAAFKPAADETRYSLQYEPYAPQELVYLDGPAPPQLSSQPRSGPPAGTATIVRYEPTRVDVAVDTPDDTFLVVSDSTTEQWHTTIDDTAAPWYRGNSIFKAAAVPAGKHVVSFRYRSPAVELSKKLMSGGLGLFAILWFSPSILSFFRKAKK